MSQSKKKLYDEFYKHLEKEYNKNWTWNAETKIKARGLFAATKSFEYILAFSLVFIELEPLRPLVTKLQKVSQENCKAYQMIDNVISELKGFRDDVDTGFETWFTVKLREVNHYYQFQD